MDRNQPEHRLPQPPRVKEYIALLTQTGTNDPTASIIKNTYTGTITWTRDTNGWYLGTIDTTEFTLLKTTAQVGLDFTDSINTAFPSANNIVNVTTQFQSAVDAQFNRVDDRLLNTLIIIKTYQ